MATVNVGFKIEPKTYHSNYHDEKKALYHLVDQAISQIDQSGLNYAVGALETVIEGDDLDQIMQLVTACLKESITNGADHVNAVIKVSYRPAGGISIDEKTVKYR